MGAFHGASATWPGPCRGLLLLREGQSQQEGMGAGLWVLICACFFLPSSGKQKKKYMPYNYQHKYFFLVSILLQHQGLLSMAGAANWV